MYGQWRGQGKNDGCKSNEHIRGRSPSKSFRAVPFSLATHDDQDDNNNDNNYYHVG